MQTRRERVKERYIVVSAPDSAINKDPLRDTRESLMDTRAARLFIKTCTFNELKAALKSKK